MELYGYANVATFIKLATSDGWTCSKHASIGNEGEADPGCSRKTAFLRMDDPCLGSKIGMRQRKDRMVGIVAGSLSTRGVSYHCCITWPIYKSENIKLHNLNIGQIRNLFMINSYFL